MHQSSEPVQPAGSAPAISAPSTIQAENQLFLNQKTFDPWLLSTSDPKRAIDAYCPSVGAGRTVGALGKISSEYKRCQYQGGTLTASPTPSDTSQLAQSSPYSQTLDMQHGTLTTQSGSNNRTISLTLPNQTWQNFWAASNIAIAGDTEAQQVTHANMFYLAGSAGAGGSDSIPPMGYSSNIYKGHIFWDAETWMFPALVVQHPDLAKGIIDYRFKHLVQAKAIAASHGDKGAEYPWESADTGNEEAPTEFSQERHITADIALAAWQYYLWTGDRAYLVTEGWPIIQANAEYWASRAKIGSDGKYHILKVIGPDETAGVVDDDAWTNAIAAKTLTIAVSAAKELGNPSQPLWTEVASGLTQPKLVGKDIYQENAQATDRLMAKQADAQMLIYPLEVSMPPKTAADTLNYYIQHTIAVGPAMTTSINSLIAARLGLAQQSLDLFHASYRPFMRGPWDAFSEKRTKDNVYFCTGMGGCLQTVLYGFAGLSLKEPGQEGRGTLVAQSSDISLYADPHLPPGWNNLTIKGVKFRGGTYDVAMSSGNKVSVTKR